MSPTIDLARVVLAREMLANARSIMARELPARHRTRNRYTMRTCGLVCISLVTALAAGSASADTYSGTLCNARGNPPNTGYSQFGTFNGSTTAALGVDCGGVTSGAVSLVTLTVYDRSPTDDVRCAILLLNAAGGVLFSTNVSTSGFASGPFTLAAVTPSIAATVVLECSIPADNAQNGASHITTYTIQ